MRPATPTRWTSATGPGRGLIALFRVLHDGVSAADGLSPAGAHGRLLRPRRVSLPRRPAARERRQTGETLDVPRISDGVVFRVLDKLLMLGGERLQYRALDVEQIG